LQVLAKIKTNTGDFSGAKEDASESQRVARLAGDLYTEANALHMEAICCKYLGNFRDCISMLERATHLLHLCGMSGGAAHSNIRSAQAEVHYSKSEYAEAHNIHTHILQNSSADQDIYEYGFALLNIAQIDVEIGGSGNHIQQSLSTVDNLFRGINYSTGLRYCDIFRAALDVQQGNLAVARTLFQECLKSMWGKDVYIVTYCLEKLAVDQPRDQAHHPSLCWPVTFLVYSSKSKQRLELHKGLQLLGNVFQAQGNLDTAISLFTVALDGFTQMDVHRSRAECIVRLGDIAQLCGDEITALEHWETARLLFQRSSQMKQLAHLDAKLRLSAEQGENTPAPTDLEQLSVEDSPNSVPS
jgi:tetratricopeptide (TPR) repeat protein